MVLIRDDPTGWTYRWEFTTGSQSTPQRPPFYRPGLERNNDIQAHAGNSEPPHELDDMSSTAVLRRTIERLPDDPSIVPPAPVETQDRGVFFKDRTAPSSSSRSRPPSYRSRVPHQDDVEARATDLTTNTAAFAGENGSNLNVPERTASRSRRTEIRNLEHEQQREEKHRYLKVIHSIQAILAFLESSACISAMCLITEGSDGKSAKVAWAHDRKNIPWLLIMLTFGVYWFAFFWNRLLMWGSADGNSQRQSARKRCVGLTQKERKAVVDILFPFILAASAVTIYRVLPWLSIHD